MWTISRLDGVWIVRFAAATLAVAACGADAQDLEPRSYANTPVGINFLIAGYSYLQGGVATDREQNAADKAASQDHPSIAREA